MKKRPIQTNCQNEPPYPEHETVVFSIRFPDSYLDKDFKIKKFKDMDKKKENKQTESEPELYTVLECVFCKGSGIAKSFDFNTELPDGRYDLNELIDTKGTYAACPDGCIVMN